MEELSHIAQEYLENYEVLRVARNRFDHELTEWWRVLVKDWLRPALHKRGEELETFDQGAKPGNFQVATARSKLFVRILDPHHSESRDYHVMVAGNSPTLKKLERNQELQQSLLSREELGVDQLFPGNQSLLTLRVPIRGDKPQETFSAIRMEMLKLLDLVVELETNL